MKNEIVKYWISLNEKARYSILFLDNSEIVQKLYQINLRLLCVGLLCKNTNFSNGHFPLLENVEFVDFNDGILSLKEEMILNPISLFRLLWNIHPSLFASRKNVFSDEKFSHYFIHNTEHVKTWKDFEIIIAVLIEQVLYLGFYMDHFFCS